MAWQIVRETFFIYINNFKKYIFPGLFTLAILVFSIYSKQTFLFLSAVLLSVLLLLADILVVFIFYDKNPLKITKTVLLSLLLDSLISLFLQCVFLQIEEISWVSETRIVSFIFSVTKSCVLIFLSFVSIVIIKHEYSFTQAVGSAIKVLSANIKRNLILYVKLFIILMSFVVLIIGVASIIVGLLQLSIVVLYSLFVAFLSLLIPFLRIAVCTYYERIE